ncbi:MAG: hypothetical protein ACTSPB_02490 [Candidatus Thorarchaeota archaeon]
MARYCSASDVRLIIQTDLDDEFIERLINLADANLDKKLGGASMDAESKRSCSMMLTAAMIAERTPQTYSIGSIRISQGPRIENWRKSVNKIISHAVGRWHVVG